MHVGIDASSWVNERGFGRFARGLIGALAARGPETGFRYTLLFDQAPKVDLPPGVEIRVAGAGQSLNEASAGTAARGPGWIWRMGVAARAMKADVFFFPAVYSWFPLLARTPSIVCYHDTIPERFPDLIFPRRLNYRLWQAKTWAARAQARRIMTVSDASAEDLTRYLSIPRARIDVVTEGADPVFQPVTDPARLAAALSACHVPDGARVLTYIGGFNRHKNVMRLIEAMPRILSAHPDAYLAIVGRTSGDRFWDNVTELQSMAGASDRIGFTGEIDDQTMANLLAASQALVFPSLWEGFGLPALEAMSCGTPVLSSDRGSLPEVVGDGGLFYDPESVDAIAGTVTRFLDDDSLRAGLREKALARTAAFGWDKGAEMAEAAFRRTAG